LISLVAGKQSIWVPALAMTPSTTAPAVAGTTEVATSLIMLKTMDFADGATTLRAQFGIRMPKSWNLGTVTYSPIWTANSTLTTNVVWQLRAMALGQGDAIATGTWGSAVTLISAGLATAQTVRDAGESGTVTIGNSPAAKDWVVFEIFRDPANASDTFAATAQLIGTHIYYTTNARDDT
jgi:hypothetical protein